MHKRALPAEKPRCVFGCNPRNAKLERFTGSCPIDCENKRVCKQHHQTHGKVLKECPA